MKVHPLLDRFALPLFVVVVGILIALLLNVEGGLAIIGVGLGSNADLRLKAKAWLMQATKKSEE